MKGPFLIILAVFSCYLSFAQKGILKGRAVDAESGEALIGANVLVAEGRGTVTDIDGFYSIELEYGAYNVVISYVGYEEFSRTVDLNSSELTLNVQLETASLKEVRIVADIAIDRQTPVAFTNVSAQQIEEDLGSRDLPMVLNSTPGIYATESGGGDGDARITIRGFNQRNIAVMLDGVPVNDMENGWVYWSNWFGLDAVTRTIQVQRGLSASKLAIPSVGGTINIITKGIESKKSITVEQELGSNWYSRTNLGITSGRLKGGWGITAAASYKRSNGWVDALCSKAWFYYGKIEKTFGSDHLLTLSAMGAPQEHGQRSYTMAIGDWDKKYANEVTEISEENLSTAIDAGLRYNQHWGYLQKEDWDEPRMFNERLNYYHKPQFSLRHSWTISPKIFLSNILYASIGNGGGVGGGGSSIPVDSAYQLNFQLIYDIQNMLGGKGQSYLRSSVNNHQWYGLLSTVNYDISDHWTFSGGIDLRTYRAEHYREVYDLLGAGYILSFDNQNRSDTTRLRVGDKIGYHNDGKVRWGGGFAMMEYSDAIWSAFLNVSASYVSYYKIDYFVPKIVKVGDEVYEVPFDDEVTVNGETYTNSSPEAMFQETNWINSPGYAIKTGANFNINAYNNIYINLGYISKAPRYNNVIYLYEVTVFEDYENEKIQAAELGYNIKKRLYELNFNGYLTLWKNKPLDSPPTIADPANPEERLPINVNGLGAFHMGIEFEGAIKVTKDLTVEGIASVGDWTWNTVASASFVDGDGNLRNFEFNPKGVHVGDAAQIQLAGMVRYEPVKDLYLKVRYTYFAKHYADFQPEDLNNEALYGKESWKTPPYGLLDFHGGYKLPVNKFNLWLGFNAINILNTKYISDARNNDSFIRQPFNDFDAKSASVFFGQGFRFSASVKLKI